MFSKSKASQLFGVVLLSAMTSQGFAQTMNESATQPTSSPQTSENTQAQTQPIPAIMPLTQKLSAMSSGTYLPFTVAPLDQALMIAPPASTTIKPSTYILPATAGTTQWGYFDKSQPPVLTINSGDTVSIETMAASDNQVVPGVSVDKVQAMNNAIEGRGPHTVTGPIYVNDAEPGDVLKIHFDKIVPRPYASNNSLPGRGLLPERFPKGQIKYFYLDVAKNQMQFAPGIVVPLGPFPGVIAVAHAEAGKFNTSPPGKFGGNMDLREMTQGTTLYLPVFAKGGLIWTGDSHAGQGNGEINLTAIETAFAEFKITVDVIKQKPLDWPRVETPTAWITVGYDTDLNRAIDIMKAETIKFIAEQQKVSPQEAEKIMYANWNCPIAEVVDGVQGTYCIIPKQITASSKPFVLPKEDNAQFFVTYAKNSDAEQAMKTASNAMIDKIVGQKGLTALDAYSLASIAMDCRMGAYMSGDKEIYCMLPKSLWVSG